MAVTNNHSPTPEEVMAYLDGEASEADHDRIEAHVAACDECRGLIDDLRHVSREAAVWSVGDPPATLRPKHSISAKPRMLAWFSRPWQIGLGTAAGLALVSIVLLPVMFRVPRPRPSPSAQVEGTSAAAAPQTEGAVMFRARQGPAAVGGRIGGRQTQTVASDRETVAERQRPMLIRTANLSLMTRDFASVRSSVEQIVRDLGGFVDQLSVIGTEGTTRSLRGVVRVPGTRLDEALARLRQLGQVVEDTQRSDEVTDQVIDLEARLANARETERRLADILRDRTGRLSDVLEVEREITRVRLEIERLDGERTNIGRRVTYAAVTINITEERKAGLEGPLSLGSRLRIALADGVKAALESVIVMLLLALRTGPALMVWLAVAGLVWLGVRRIPRFGTRG
jgi:hypothetical protein